MSATLSRIAALVLFVWTPLPVRADKIDTEHLFAFTIGTDPGELGEKEIEGKSTGRFGKRDGSYTGLSQVLSAEFTPVENLRLEVSAASIYHDIAGVTGLDDRRRGGWQALSLDVRYRLLDREQTSFGLLIDAEPRWGRIFVLLLCWIVISALAGALVAALTSQLTAAKPLPELLGLVVSKIRSGQKCYPCLQYEP